MLNLLQIGQMVRLQKRQGTTVGKSEAPRRRIAQTAPAEVFDVGVHSPASDLLSQQCDGLPVPVEPVGGVFLHEWLGSARIRRRALPRP
jgi:hypothetical protein